MILRFYWALLVLGISMPVAAARVTFPTYLETLDGKKIVFSEHFSKKRFLLISFWATWCHPCLEELKLLKKHADELSFLDILAINVDTSETSVDVTSSVRLNGITFPVVMDPSHSFFSKLNPAKTVPFSVIIRPNGDIESTFTGFDHDVIEKLKALNK